MTSSSDNSEVLEARSECMELHIASSGNGIALAWQWQMTTAVTAQ